MAQATSRELQTAARRGETERVSELLNRNPRDEMNLRRATTALMRAVEGGNLETTRALLDYGADPNQGRSRNGFNSIGEALHRRKCAVLELLLERGADPHTRMNDEYALIHAARNHYPDCVAALLKYGADPEVSAYEEYEKHWHGTALCEAVTILGSAGAFYTANVLLEHGAIVNPPSPQRKSALFLVVRQAYPVWTYGTPPYLLNMIELLLQHGADPHHGEGFQVTPLKFAELRGLHDVVELVQRYLKI